MNQRVGAIATGPRLNRRRVPKVAQAGYWKHSPWVAITMLSLVGIRLHELYPQLSSIRPVLMSVVIGGGLLLFMTSPSALRSARDYPISKIVLAYFAWIAATAPLGIWPGGSFMVWRGMVSPILMFFAVILCAPTQSNLQKILWGVTGATALSLLVNLTASAPGDYWRLGSEGAYDPNDMAALFAAVLPLGFGLFLRSRGFPKTVALAISVVLVVGLLQTGSRGGVVATMVGALVFVLAHRGFRFFVVLFGVTIGGVLAWQSASPEFRERMMTLTALSEDYNVDAEMGRVEIWKRGMSYFAERPVFGVGAGNFTEREGTWLLSQNRRGKWSAAHNGYVQAAAELGAIGIWLFLALIVSVLIRAKRMWRVKVNRKTTVSQGMIRPEMMASACAVATSAVFLSMAYSWILFSITALVALADRVNIAEAESRAQMSNAAGLGR